MEYSLRSFRVFNRLFRRPFAFATYKSAATLTAKEDTNMELLQSYNADIKNGGVVPVFRRALLFPSRVALQDDDGVYTYAGLHQAASILSKEISAQLVGETGRTIPYLCGNNATHVIIQWAIWMSGNIALPLSSLHPEEMIKYFIEDSSASMVICSPDYEKILRPITLKTSKPLLVTDKQNSVTAQQYEPNSEFIKTKECLLTDSDRTNSWYAKSDAMLIYTSGTTSKPKGVVWTHKMLMAQISSLHAAWQYSANDVVLHCLPLHHIHGQLNSLNATLAAGARLQMLQSFAPHTVWAKLLSMESAKDEPKVTVFHGVPAMYARLANEHRQMFGEDRATLEYVRTSLATRMRLMCAGSAPLPETLAKKWEEITGHRLLERYGMSEVGMALSNPYRPVEGRTVGAVGLPLPGCSARVATPLSEKGDRLKPLVTVETPMCDMQISLQRLNLISKNAEDAADEEGHKFQWIQPTVTTHDVSEDDTYQGELLLKGTGVFSRYWNRSPSLTQKDFTEDGWFRTGDTVLYSEGRFKIQGRTSIDIIKTAGYKVSALQIESAILEHPLIEDAAVLGVPHETYGEVVAAVVTLKPDQKLDLKDLRALLGKKLASYQLPRTVVIVDTMPRNVMGKLDKKEIKRLFAKELKLKKDA